MKKGIGWSLCAVFGLVIGAAGVGCGMSAGPGDDVPAPGEDLQPVIGCPYQTLQARVQPDIQTPWNQLQSIPLGHTVRLAGFGDARAVIDSSGNITLALKGPDGVVRTFPNDTTISLAAGTYQLTAKCGTAPSDAAWIVVQGPGCPYSSVQVRVQPNVQTAWTQTLVINRGQRFHVGAMFDGVAQLAPSGVVLTVIDPNNVSTSPANNTFVTAAIAGIYQVTGTCGAMEPQHAVVIAQ